MGICPLSSTPIGRPPNELRGKCPSRSILCRSLDLDAEAERLEWAHEVSRGTGLGERVEVRVPQVCVDGAVGQDAVGDDQDLVRDGERGSPDAHARLEPVVLAPEVATFLAYGGHRG